MKSSKAVDRRVQRTHRLLTDALIQLILERGWDSVSVQDICERADIGRSTFYTHFADKEDLLVGGLSTLGQFLREQAAATGSQQPLAFARGVIEHVDEQRRLFKALAGKRSGHLAQQHFRDLLVDLVREDLQALAPASPRLDVAVRYVAGAFFELLVWWLEARTQLKPADLEELFHELTTPVLALLKKVRGRGV